MWNVPLVEALEAHAVGLLGLTAAPAPAVALVLLEISLEELDVALRNADADGKSGRCLVLVTADAERTMNTFLGVSSQLSVADIDEEALAGSLLLC